jgi:xylulose-5-phosphate/fructose-6-phosphate phosphoketolase
MGQIYLLDNPLLREPLTLERVKPRLLGHRGTTPGLVANAYLEGTYSEVYPQIGRPGAPPAPTGAASDVN